MKSAPQLVQYQGSKRKLAPQILPFFPDGIHRLVEPFSGMAAITVACAMEQKADSYWINDVNSSLIGVIESAINNPEGLYEGYKAIWDAQYSFEEGHIAHYYRIRDEYNDGDTSAAVTLYLLARCVKGAVRYSADGKFNQSPDKRRHGTKPERVLKSAIALNKLLYGRVKLTSYDYADMLDEIEPGDFVYMDPPYQGVSNTRDHRYFAGVELDSLVLFLEGLNCRNVPFVLSYDGSLGDKTYGKDLPDKLNCKKMLLDAGLSAQSTLLGKPEKTFEGLYLSKALYSEE